MGKKAFDDIMAGLQDALAYAQGDGTRGRETIVEVPAVDVRAARHRPFLQTAQLFRQTIPPFPAPLQPLTLCRLPPQGRRRSNGRPRPFGSPQLRKPCDTRALRSRGRTERPRISR